MQQDVSSSTTTVDNLKLFGQELTELWIYKCNDEQRIWIYLAIDPKGQRDLQCQMIFYIISKSYGLLRSIRPIIDSIQRKRREISAIECLMTSCLRDRKRQKSDFYEIKVILILLLPKNILISNRHLITEIFQFKYIDDVIHLQPEVPFFNDHSWKYKVTQSMICGCLCMNQQIKQKRNNMHWPCPWP